MSLHCKTCNEFIIFPDRHKCAPVWKVWPNHYEEADAWEIRAYDAGNAAEKWAERYGNGGDYTIIGGSEETVTVMGEDGIKKQFKVSGETVPNYYAVEEKRDVV